MEKKTPQLIVQISIIMGLFATYYPLVDAGTFSCARITARARALKRTRNLV
jgi:hypothetical protein